MDVSHIKQMMDACYLAKRARELLPPLPAGVTPAYIHYLDVIQAMEGQGKAVRISDVSDALGLPRPGVTRTVKEMEAKGYLAKHVSTADGRVTYLTLTEAGRALHRQFDADYFRTLAPFFADIPEEDVACTIRTIEQFYNIMRAHHA